MTFLANFKFMQQKISLLSMRHALALNFPPLHLLSSSNNINLEGAKPYSYSCSAIPIFHISKGNKYWLEKSLGSFLKLVIAVKNYSVEELMAGMQLLVCALGRLYKCTGFKKWQCTVWV